MAKDEVACRCREKSGGRETGAVAFLPALGPWAPPAKRGPSLESIYRVSLTVDLCEGNKIISFKKFTSPQPVGAPQKEKKIWGPWARAQCAHWLRRPWTGLRMTETSRELVRPRASVGFWLGGGQCPVAA